MKHFWLAGSSWILFCDHLQKPFGDHIGICTTTLLLRIVGLKHSATKCVDTENSSIFKLAHLHSQSNLSDLAHTVPKPFSGHWFLGWWRSIFQIFSLEECIDCFYPAFIFVFLINSGEYKS